MISSVTVFGVQEHYTGCTKFLFLFGFYILYIHTGFACWIFLFVRVDACKFVLFDVFIECGWGTIDALFILTWVSWCLYYIHFFFNNLRLSPSQYTT
jgi:hypothetical protein